MASYLGTAAAPQNTTIANGVITTAKLANGAVTAVKVANDVATQAELDLVEAGHFQTGKSIAMSIVFGG
jgi:glutamate synthase domain-containing protein 2